MLRPLYRWVLRLHPSGFRKRFADEMLSIFDHRVGKPAALSLLVDGLVSLARQWALRSEFWHELSPAQEPGEDDIPSFYTLDPFRSSCWRRDSWPRAVDGPFLPDLLRHQVQLDP